MIIGHQKQWQWLEALAKANKISHAYLFIGQEKLGKKTLAKEWVRLLISQKQDNFSPPDLFLIEPTNQEITIEDIRNLIQQFSLKPLSLPFKAAIIDNVHLMNQEAQTCLLKTLEEPRGKAIFILITDKPDLLLPTIVSRVQIIKFNPVKKEEIKNYLLNKNISPIEAEEISQMVLGRPGLAIDFLDKEKREDFKKVISEIKKILGASVLKRFQYAKKIIQDQEEITTILDIWLNYFRANFIQQMIEQNKDQKKEDSFNQISLKKIKILLEKIQETKNLILSTNVNLQLALENLLLEF